MKQTDARGESKSDIKQLIGFFVGAEEYGLAILRVKEIIRLKEITRLPQSPQFVKGIINLRGDVIPILSLAEKFGLEAREAGQAARVIVAEIEGRLIGMMVDAVSQVLRIPADQIDPPPEMIGGLSRQFVQGVGKLGDRLVILLNIDRVLSSDEKEELNRLETAIADESVREVTPAT
jgi:purine-binding chemotaxis protein CheW